ncbi:hypothetical protein EVAR_60553_1 [Eumeta japonica]|uniref:Uncharacterized protein n=1 Tax=Eumeta variegata TaxID=151549 RepID=A0A4C1YHD4_EUMVA|nr:hypothetical protein EVAR_60553_1 [Eumeta japonica]
MEQKDTQIPYHVEIRGFYLIRANNNMRPPQKKPNFSETHSQKHKRERRCYPLFKIYERDCLEYWRLLRFWDVIRSEKLREAQWFLRLCTNTFDMPLEGVPFRAPRSRDSVTKPAVSVEQVYPKR